MTPICSSLGAGFDELDYRAQQLRDQSQSGLSVAEYCRRHNLLATTFYHWRRQAREQTKDTKDTRQPGGVSFTEIARVGGAQVQWVAEIALPSGAVVRVSTAADARLLRMVMEAVG